MDIEKIMAWGMEKMNFVDEAPLEKGYRYYHGKRTAQIALSLAQGMNLPVDRDTLFAGAFLHDVGKAGFNGPHHGARGEDMIRQEIAQLFSPAELEQVCSIVRYHYTRPHSHYSKGHLLPALSVETLLVQDADALDHFGGNALWLAFRWSGAHGRNPGETIRFYREQDAVWRHDALRGLNFPLSRRELQARIARTDAFFALWEEEERGELTHMKSKLQN
ncbi:MAG: hypothetical protein DDT37_00043 [Firmicutes bacterium]|nr:hypothetical protein [candidate division NPL-UPA2 bacterium]